MTTRTIDALRDSRGAFSMLAIDQRGSLRAMLAAAQGVNTVPDADIIDFKVAVSRLLTPAASAVLIDREFGAEAAKVAKCPIILAADILSASVPGGPVDTAEIDDELTSEVIANFGAEALKMLVPWTPETRDAAVDLSARFMELCRQVDLPGIVEGVVRPADIAEWSDERRDDALVTASQDLAQTKPDLYKAEIPSYGAGPAALITATAQRITDSLECPWVVLSSGVTADVFPSAVAASRAGGAEGFLAGRAIWADAITADDTLEFLTSMSVSRLTGLAADG